MAHTQLDQLMKSYEHAYRRKVSPTDYILLRLDGKAFHTFTRGLERPYDRDLIRAMQETTVELCQGIQGVRFAYTQSDEISLLITPWDSLDADISKLDPAFGGVEAKLISISASIATAAFNKAWAKSQGSDGVKTAHFDSRLWTFSGTEEGEKLVRQYFDWRRLDCTRNSVSMAAQAQFSHKDLMGVGVSQMKVKLKETGKPWEEEPLDFRYGSLVTKQTYLQDVTYTHRQTGATVTTKAQRNMWTTRYADSPDWPVPAPLTPQEA